MQAGSKGLVAFVVVTALTAGLMLGAKGADAAGAQTCDPSQYAMSLQALTTPHTSADLLIRVTTIAPCPVPSTFPEVHVTVGARHVDLVDVPTSSGTALVKIGAVARHQRVQAAVKPEPEVTLTGVTRALLRPDLAVRRVRSPLHALSGRPFNLRVVVTQRTPDVAANATVTVSAAGAPVGSALVKIAPRRSATVVVPVTLAAVGRNRLFITVGSDPPEAITSNNRARRTVEATQFEIVRSHVVVPSLAGYGGQFNHHVYAAISRATGVDDTNVVDMERKMHALHPQFSRIFFTPQAFTDPDKMQSFVRTVLLAQSTGTTINITWQGGALNVQSGTVQKFADVLIDLVNNRGVSRLRWLTLQNEPNRTKITPEQYEAQYRALDPYIQSIRGQVKYMGGDLVRGPDTGAPNQDVWFQYLATHMADILDAYSIHVFWDYWDTQKLQDRLNEVRAIVDALPPSGQKPLYVAEYGVRGLRTFNGAKTLDPGVWTDGTPITQTNVSAFQHEWFDVLSSRLGYLGTSKWDAYYGKYDNADQAYWMIGTPQNGWPLYPMYHLMRMVTTTVQRGWEVVGVDQMDGTTQLVTSYFGPKGQRTVVGLDTAGAQLNDASGASIPYVVGGLTPLRKLNLVVWNRDGDGLTKLAGTVTVDAYGVANFAIPQQSVFALTTQPAPSAAS